MTFSWAAELMVLHTKTDRNGNPSVFNLNHNGDQLIYIRYADDFVILHKNKEYLENILPKISEFLEKRLRLSLHPNKVFIKTYASGIDFLGWVHFSHHRILRTSTKKRIFRNLKVSHKKGSLESYLGLLKHGNAHKIRNKIEQIVK